MLSTTTYRCWLNKSVARSNSFTSGFRCRWAVPGDRQKGGWPWQPLMSFDGRVAESSRLPHTCYCSYTDCSCGCCSSLLLLLFIFHTVIVHELLCPCCCFSAADVNAAFLRSCCSCCSSSWCCCSCCKAACVPFLTLLIMLLHLKSCAV